MIMAKNPWLPLVEPPRLAPLPDHGRVLVIIPTAGKHLKRLGRCLDSLERAAGGMPHRTVLVLCPATAGQTGKVRAFCGGRAEVLPVEGQFNYCRSLNAGLAQRRPGEGYALFLNDDVEFCGRGDLAQLKQTLRNERWACVGPFIPGWHPDHSEVKRQAGAVRTNEPVNGCCALWDLKWLDRIGPLDEEFGRGWGLDEADLCLRAVRNGARYGRDDSVAIRHEHHGTFGESFTAYDGPAHQRNLRYFQRKHGTDVGGWGRTEHWVPLPGVQVSMATHNAGKWVERCLDSVERALDGFRWSLFIGDDCSTDGTWDLIQQHCQTRSGADFYRIKRYQRKAATVDRAKNRVLALGAPFRRQYPAMCLMDADDEMGLHRVRQLLWRARDHGLPAVMGDHECIEPGGLRRLVTATEESQINGGFGPWATIFHSNLVPANGRLFGEDRNRLSHGDVDLWLRWFVRGIRIVPFPGQIVHHYHMHDGTVSRPRDRAFGHRMREQWFRKRARLLSRPTSIQVQLYSQPSVQARLIGEVKHQETTGLRNGTFNKALRVLTSPRMYSQPAVQARLNGEIESRMIGRHRNGGLGAPVHVLTSPQMYSQPTVLANERPVVKRTVMAKGRNGAGNGHPLRVLASPKMYSELTVR